jgi:N-acetylneuraminic acid mutarotase
MKAYCLVTILLISATGLNAQGTWATGTNLPSPRMYSTAAEYDGKIYLFGGCQFPPDISESTVFRLDPGTGIWTEMNQMPEHLTGMVSVRYGDKIYIIGGGPTVFGIPSGKMFLYDPETDLWEQKADMITPRSFCAAGIVNGKIYTVGGSIGFSSTNLVPVDNVEVYDPLTDTWTEKNPFPKDVLDATAANNQGLYIMGGTDYPPFYGMEETYFYDAGNDSWLEVPPLNFPRWGCPAVVLDSNVYMIGGCNYLGIYYDENEYYSPASEMWFIDEPMPTERRSHAAAAADGKIYIVGGLGDVVLDNVEIFTPLTTAAPMPLVEKRTFTADPNPATGVVSLAYNVLVPGEVEIHICDVMNRQIREIFHQNQLPGDHELTIDLSDMPSGMYYLFIKSEDVAVSFEKMVIIH